MEQLGRWSVFDKIYLKLAGIHRVQRVSATEKSNRRHSSTIIVSVIEDVKKTSFNIVDEDLRVDTFRASGPGGQHRNKTDSGVRIIHLPTGIMVTATEDRSQHTNRQVAYKRIEEKLSLINDSDQHEKMNQQREVSKNEVSFVWTEWRDQVKNNYGSKTSMLKALKGKLSPLLK